MKKIDVSELQGPLTEFMQQMSGENGRKRFEEFKLWQKGVSLLLQPVATVEVAEVRRLVSRERLTKANVGWTGDNFKRLLLEKVEENVPAGRIAVDTLVRGALDFEIQAALGRARRVIHLAHFFQLLEKQAKDQAGSLLTNGNWNIAYCFGSEGNVWAVSAARGPLDRDWLFGARSVGRPSGWHAGAQVLSQAA